jgi:hypothetical protein
MIIIDMFALEGRNNPGAPGSCCVSRIITAQHSFFEQQDSFEDVVYIPVAAFQSQETTIHHYERKTATPTPEEVQEKEAAAEVAQKTSDEIAKSDPNVKKVDTIAEAEKEKASIKFVLSYGEMAWR